MHQSNHKVLVRRQLQGLWTVRSVRNPFLSSLRRNSDRKSTCSIGPALFLVTVIGIVVIWRQLQDFVENSLSVNRFLYTELGKVVPLVALLVWFTVDRFHAGYTPDSGFLVVILIL